MTGLPVEVVKKLLEKPYDRFSDAELEFLVRSFPTDTELDYKLLKLFLDRRGVFSHNERLLRLLKERLTLTDDEIALLLSGRPVEVSFPVVNEEKGKAFVNRLLVAPLKGSIRFFGKFNERKLRELKELTGKGFLVVAENPEFKGDSYSLALYAALTLGERSEPFAFTGIVSRDGRIEEVAGFELKLRACEEKGLPLIFAKKSVLESVKDLETFFRDLRIPLSALFEKEKALSFDRCFRFTADYVQRVFHLRTPLHYEKELSNSEEGFAQVRRWLKALLTELQDKIPAGFSWRLAIAQRVVAASFLTGVELSLRRIKAEFFNFDEGVYKKLYDLEDDKFPEDLKPVEKWFRIKEPTLRKFFRSLGFNVKPFNEVLIKTKSGFESRRSALQLVAKNPNLPPGEFKEIAASLSEFLRRKCDRRHSYELEMEVPVGLAFALGYYLENLIPFKVKHRGKVVYEVGKW